MISSNTEIFLGIFKIKLEKNGVNQGWISVECKRSRNRGFETFSFTINENGLPEFVDNDYDL